MATNLRKATQGDWTTIAEILVECSLPLDGAKDHLDSFIVAEHNGSIVGCAALERHGKTGLLRSLAVRSAARGEAIGEHLVRTILTAASRGAMRQIVLLTTTAAEWFPRFGFHRVHRDTLDPELQASEEFRGACPTSAVAMLLELGG